MLKMGSSVRLHLAKVSLTAIALVVSAVTTAPPSQADEVTPMQVHVSVGMSHACATVGSGDATYHTCWGRNINGSVSGPGSGYGLSNFSTGDSGTCYVLSNKSVQCDGGYLGNLSSSTPYWNDIKEVVNGNGHACVLHTDSTLSCWNYDGDNYWSASPAGIRAKQVVVGGDTVGCALLLDSKVQCWGNNWFSQTEPPSGLADVVQLIAGVGHVCALKSNGTVVCWGINHQGQLDVPFGLNSVTKISGNGWTVCALKSDQSIVCWGDNSSSQLNVPSDLGKVSDISVGGRFTCAVTVASKIRCWGDNSYGQLDVPDFTPASPSARISKIGNGQLTFKATPSEDDGGTPVTGFEYSIDNQNWLKASVADVNTGVTVTGLITGNIYSLKVRALNANGTGKSISVAMPQIPQGPIYMGGSCCSTGWNENFKFNSRQWLDYVEYSTDYGQSWIQAEVTSWDYFLYRGPVARLLVIRSCNNAAGCQITKWFYGYASNWPPAPPNVKISSIGATSAKIDYTPNEFEWNTIGRIAYSINGGAYAIAEYSGSLELTGLTPRTNYTIDVKFEKGYNSGVFGVPSEQLAFKTQADVASNPILTSTVLGSSQATVYFNSPSDNGGSQLTNYEYSTDNGSTWTTASPAQTTSPLVIAGLSNGTTYLVRLRAVNGAGSGAASNAVSVKPVAPASAPSISGVIAGNGQATLSIGAPAQINDSSLSGYDYSINNGSTWSHFASVTGPFTITGLTNATAYQVKVRAVNSAGAGEASAAVTVNPTRLIPAKPVIGSVVGGNGSATVNIAAPKDVTAQSIAGYQYSIDKGKTYQSAIVSNGSFTITGLTNGVSTSVQVRATNFNGNSLASLAKTVVPATSPAAPSITTITPSAGALSIAFTAPSNGGSAITSYQYSLDGGSTWIAPKTAVKTSPLKVTGLPNATAYQVKIRAVNAKGTGLASDAVSASTPVLVPSAPVTTSIAKSSTTFTVDVTAPINNGGGAITNYAYSVDSGKTWIVVSPASNSTRIVITGLKPSTVYPVQIAAINSAGRGAASAKYNAATLR